MKKYIFLFLISLSFLTALPAPAATTRVEKLFENDEVTVSKITLEPHQPLPMHHGDHRRIVIALTDLHLSVKNNHGKYHQFVMKKGTAHFLPKDPPNELHSDVNNSKHTMQPIVVEWKKE